MIIGMRAEMRCCRVMDVNDLLLLLIYMIGCDGTWNGMSGFISDHAADRPNIVNRW